MTQRDPSWSNRGSVKLWISALGTVPFFTSIGEMNVQGSFVLPILLSPLPTITYAGYIIFCINIRFLYWTVFSWPGEGTTLVGICFWDTSSLLPPAWVNPNRETLQKRVLSMCQELEKLEGAEAQEQVAQRSCSKIPGSVQGLAGGGSEQHSLTVGVPALSKRVGIKSSLMSPPAQIILWFRDSKMNSGIFIAFLSPREMSSLLVPIKSCTTNLLFSPWVRKK